MSEYRPFALERAFDEFEFKPGVRQFSCSDGEPLPQSDLLALADPECRRLWDDLTLAYTHVGGHPLLVKELTREDGVCAYDSQSGIQVLPAVPQECILLAMMALCDHISSECGGQQPDFEAVVVWPSYQSLFETLRSRGVALKHWTLKAASDSAWTFDLEELRGLLGDRTRLLVVNFPHNPSGYSPSEQHWLELIELCRSRGIYLFSDEIYNACSPHSPQRPAVVPAANLYDRAVSMSGLSKCFGLAGLRLGWLASRNQQLLQRARLLKDYTTICVPAPVEILGLIALRSSASLTGRIRNIVAKNCQLARAFFARHRALFLWREPVAGTTALVEMRDALLSKFEGSGRAFCQEMVDRFGIFVLSSDDFQFGDRCFRIGLGRRDLGEIFSLVDAALMRLQLAN